MLLLTGLVVAIQPAPTAHAALHNPITFNSSEEPSEEFTDADALFAYVTSDVQGGHICIVDGSITDPAAASCDRPAWGTENTVLGIGSIITLIEAPPPPLEPGEWRLLVEDSVGEQHELSQPFYVTPCPECSHEISDAVQEFKDAAAVNAVGAATTCVGLSVKDIKASGNGARGKITGLTKKANRFEAGTASFGATMASVGGFAVGLSFEIPDEHYAEEKAMEILKNLTCGLSLMYIDIVNDPVDPDYTSIVQPEFSPTTAVETPVGDAAVQAIDRVRAFGLAELTSYERYLGATEAGDERYVHAQASAIASLGREHIEELRSAAAALGAFAVELDSQPEFAEPVVTQERRDQLAAIYARIRAEGFTADEITQLHGLGFSDAQISDIRTHFSVDVSQIPVGETLQSVLRTTAQGFEDQIPHYDAFAREAAAVAGRTNEPPLASFDASPANGPAPLEVTFHSTSSSPDLDPIESVEWDFGDGSTGTGADVKHTYEADGTYTATLTISDGMFTAQSQNAISVGANSEEISAADDSLETEEDTVGNVDVLANDTPAGALEVIEFTDGASGTVSCDPSGCAYDPAQDFNGSDSFTYTASDGESQATATVSVTVSPVNDLPVAEADAATLSLGATSVVIDVLANDTPGPEGYEADQTLTLTELIAPQHGAAEIITSGEEAGKARYTPEAGYNGDDFFEYTVCDDGSPAPACATARVDVDNHSQAPVAVDDSLETEEDTVGNVDVLANDTPAGALEVIEFTDGASGTVSCDPSGCAYDPAQDFNGSDSFTYTASDGESQATATVSVTVSPVNDLPVAEADAATLSLGATSVVIDVLANDTPGPEGYEADQTLTLTELTAPPHGTAEIITSGEEAGKARYTLEAGYNGDDFFEYTVCDDGSPAPACATARVDIHNPNQAPVAVDDSLETEEDESGTVDVIANDSPPAFLQVITYTQGANGFVICSGSECSYYPAQDFNGSDSFTYTASDGESQATATVSVTVSPVNDLPVAEADAATLSLGATSVVIDVLANDTPGPEGYEADQTLTLTELIAPQHGAAEIITSGEEAGKARYTPEAGYHGDDFFEYTACDDGTTAGTPATACATASVAVHVASQPPAAVDDVFTVSEDTETVLDPLANDFDPDGDPLSLTVGATTAHGTLICTSEFCYYTPEQDFNGIDEFTYEVESAEEIATATAKIEVTPVNDDPVLEPDRVVTQRNTAASADVLANDSDVDGDPLFLTGAGDAAHGQVTCAVDGVCEYTPDSGYDGADEFSYTASDGVGGAVQGHVSVVVLRAVPSSGVPDNKGTDFWVAFTPNYSGPPELSLFITGDSSTSGTVEIPALSFSKEFTVTPGNVTTVAIPPEAFDETRDGIGDKGIHVTAGNEVAVYGLNRIKFTTDAFLGLPTEILGTEYLVPAWDSGTETTLAVLATEDGTTITVTPPIDTENRFAGVPFDIELDAGQVYQLMPTGGGDLTGTEVKADKPVAVFGGNRCANVPAGVPACDHLVEEIPPTSTWGKSFVTMPLATRMNGDTFRILASADGTQVSINGSEVAMLDRGQFHEQLIDGPSTITADQPILVVQFSNGSLFDGVTSDPFMLIVPPYEQFLSSYTVTTPAKGFAKNFINIAVAAGGEDGVRLDGVPVPVADFEPIGSSGFFGAQLAVELGSHVLEGTSPFGAFMYGFDEFDSYGYPGGLSLGEVAEVVHVTLSPKSATRQVGDEDCIDALVTDSAEDPLEGIRVDFKITGANDEVGSASSDGSGIAVFCYTGQAEGDDAITASVGTVSDAAARTWSVERLGKLEVKKALVPASDPGRFDLQIDGAADPDAIGIGDGGSSGEQTLSAGTHTVGESAASGTSLAKYATAIACRTENGAGATIAQGADAGPLDVNLAEDADVLCTITNTRKPQLGKLEVKKALVPASDPGRFDLQIDGAADPDAIGIGDGGSSGEQTLSAGTHTVGESAASGTSLAKYATAIACRTENGAGATIAQGADAGPLDVNLAEDADVLCTITNTRKPQLGKLEVKKALVPASDPGRFDLQIDGAADPDAIGIGDGGSSGEQTLSAGTHTVGESAASGTSLAKYATAIACRTENGAGATIAQGADAGPLDVNLAEDADVLCTITNTRKPQLGKLEVKKALVPASDPGRFDLQIDGAADPDAIGIGDGGSSGEQTLSAGTHTVGESAASGTSLAKYATAIACRTENGAGATIAQGTDAGPLDVNLAEDADVLCTITNTRKQPEILVVEACPAAVLVGHADVDGDGILDACDEDPSLPDFCDLRMARARVFLYTKKPKVRLVVRYRTKKPADVTTSYSAKGTNGRWLRIGKLKQRFASEGMFRLPKVLQEPGLGKVRSAKEFKVKFSIPGTSKACSRFYTKHLTLKKSISGQTVFFQSDSLLTGF